jgi:hypothetical protein
MIATLLLALGLAQAQTVNYQYGTPRVETQGVGAGLVLGSPTGVTLSYRPEGYNAAQAALGWSFADSRMSASADYLRTLTVVRPAAPFHVPVYVGAGAGLNVGVPGIGEKSRMFQSYMGIPQTGVAALRVPFGASIFFDRAPVELFTQLVPTLRVLPGLTPGVEMALGGRYYF